jgi:hypothetical protein
MLYAKTLWPDYDLFVLERAFSSGVGNDVKIFGVKLDSADDVKGVPALSFPYAGKPVTKRLLAWFSSLPGVSPFPFKPDNLESLAAGPTLGWGDRILLLASDNNFSSDQTNQFVALRLSPPSVRGPESPACAVCGRGR